MKTYGDYIISVRTLYTVEVLKPGVLHLFSHKGKDRRPLFLALEIVMCSHRSVDPPRLPRLRPEELLRLPWTEQLTSEGDTARRQPPAGRPLIPTATEPSSQ